MDVASLPPTQTPAAPAKPESGEASFKLFGDDGLSFWDILDVINPLQHIPVVNTVYRAITGDTIDAAPRMIGGALLGGPIGLLVSAIDAVTEQATGKDVGQHVVAAISGSAGDAPADVEVAGKAPPPNPATPAASVASVPTEAAERARQSPVVARLAVPPPSVPPVPPPKPEVARAAPEQAATKESSPGETGRDGASKAAQALARVERSEAATAFGIPAAFGPTRRRTDAARPHAARPVPPPTPRGLIAAASAQPLAQRAPGAFNGQTVAVRPAAVPAMAVQEIPAFADRALARLASAPPAESDTGSPRRDRPSGHPDTWFAETMRQGLEKYRAMNRAESPSRIDRVE